MSVSPATNTLPTSTVNMFSIGAVPVKAKASTTTGTSSSTGDGLTGSTAGSTFLNLLVKELQNQDPTAPMDSTAMVGQMISLNQLDQLISINQTLGTVTTTTTTSPTKGHVQGSSDSESSSSLLAARAALMNAASPASYVNSATSAASDPSSTLDFSALSNQFGGK